MTTEALSLARLRAALGRTWLIALFGVVYLASQVTILLILGPLRAEVGALQLFGSSAEHTLATLRAWEQSGALAAYRAHFVFDDVHWVWYSAFFTTLLCRLFARHGVPHRFDWLLLLPLVSGLADAYENHLQHVYLSTADFSTVVDPLPLLGTLASWLKWSLVTVYVGLVAVLLVRVATRRRRTR